MYTKPNSLLRSIRYRYKAVSNFLFNIYVGFKSNKTQPKVFCIGFMKSGTTSFGVAMKKLGFDHTTFNVSLYRNHYEAGQMDKVLDYVRKFDSFDDLPWYKEDMIPILDKTFPESKFVYLTRTDADWKSSFSRWSEKISGAPVDVEKWFADFIQHRAFVMSYFESRSSADFLVLDISDPLGYKKLGDFLNVKVPADHFPHMNIT